MDLVQLQAFVADADTKAAALQQQAYNFGSFVSGVKTIVNGQFASTIFNTQQAIDNFVAAQTPPYTVLLTAIEVATDALGTDPLH